MSGQQLRIDMAEPTPLVIVEGFLAGGIGARLWRPVEKHINACIHGTQTSPRRLLHVSVGPVSSLHDRACELYYAIRGGTVDYGAKHSSTHNHARFGRVHAVGAYPQWSPSQPLHFLGHSIGGVTITKMQHLMSIGHFGGDAHPDMVLSINSIVSPFRGTQAVYALGHKLDSAPEPGVRRISLGALGSKLVLFTAFIEPICRLVDFHTESRSLSYKDLSFRNFLRQLWGPTDWAEGRDGAPYDVTFRAADERESQNEGKPFPNTYYQSHVFSVTKRITPEHKLTLVPPYHTPLLSILLLGPLYILSRCMGRFDFSQLRPRPQSQSHAQPVSKPNMDFDNEKSQDNALDETYWANDGVVPVFSQFHPLPCSSTKCRHKSVSDTDVFSHDRTLIPGEWEVRRTEEPHPHSFLIPPLCSNNTIQALFWENLGHYLTCVDGAHSGI